jgi:hypothetical protein
MQPQLCSFHLDLLSLLGFGTKDLLEQVTLNYNTYGMLIAARRSIGAATRTSQDTPRRVPSQTFPLLSKAQRRKSLEWYELLLPATSQY